MSARSKARKRALDILFEADLRSSSAIDLLELRPPQDLSQGEYSEALIRGVSDHREKIDELIATASPSNKIYINIIDKLCADNTLSYLTLAEDAYSIVVNNDIVYNDLRMQHYNLTEGVFYYYV